MIARYEIMRKFRMGMTPIQICRELQLSLDRVRNHIRIHEAIERSQCAFEDHPELPPKWYDQPLTYFVYALGAAAVKIGFTERGLPKRLRGLATASPFELIPCAVIMGGRKRESAAHRSLCHCCIRREWFHSCDEVWEYAEKNGVFVYHHWIEPIEGMRAAADASPEVYEPTAHDECVRKSIKEAFEKSSLFPREREILRLRLGLNDDCQELTLEEVGKRLSLTRERVRQLEKRGISRLKKDPILKDMAS